MYIESIPIFNKHAKRSMICMNSWDATAPNPRQFLCMHVRHYIEVGSSNHSTLMLDGESGSLVLVCNCFLPSGR